MKLLRTYPCCHHYLGLNYILQIITMNNLQLKCSNCGKQIGYPKPLIGRGLGILGFVIGLYLDEIFLYLFNIDISNNYKLSVFILITIILSFILLYYYLYPLKCYVIDRMDNRSDKYKL